MSNQKRQRRGRERTSRRGLKRKLKLLIWKVILSNYRSPFFFNHKQFGFFLAVPHASPPASPTQEVVAADRTMVAAPSSTSNPPAKDSSEKGKSHTTRIMGFYGIFISHFQRNAIK